MLGSKVGGLKGWSMCADGLWLCSRMGYVWGECDGYEMHPAFVKAENGAKGMYGMWRVRVMLTKPKKTN